MSSRFRPPPDEIDSVRIHAYAVIDGDVEWTGATGGPIVLADGELVGPVARLGIGVNYDGRDYLLLYCTNDWEALERWVIRRWKTQRRGPSASIEVSHRSGFAWSDRNGVWRCDSCAVA